MDGRLRRRIGGILIAGGVLAWVPYFALQLDPSQDVPLLPFLIVHLSGVIPGSLLLGRGLTASLLQRLAAGSRGGAGQNSRSP
ncbi:MAG: hypothetical protein ACE5NC_05005 [Anaerolineae bacterium]